jgi:outer membrane receptor protein involved in Fe transport
MFARNSLLAAAALALSGSALAQPTSSPSTNPATQPADSITPLLPPPAPVLPATDQALPISAPPTSAPLSGLLPSTLPVLPATQPAPRYQPSGSIDKILVTSDLDQTRDQIAPPLGAQTYSIGPAQIANMPQGENATFQQVLLRAPGVVEDSYGQVHVRGEHANLTYRVNGILLPEGLNGFGQELDTHLIDSVTLIDGTLPAQFGFRTAGIVDVTTKSGDTLSTNELSLYVGGHDTLQPSVVTGGSIGKLDYFVAGESLHNNLGIENTTSGSQALHDDTNQQRIFSYLAYRLDDSSRLSLLINASNANFQIPDTAGLPPFYPLAGHPNGLTSNSTGIDENQNEQQYYSMLAYQKSVDKLSLQWAAFTRYGQIHFTPDPVADLIFQGVAGEVQNSFSTNGTQFDASYVLNDQHTIRAGFLSDFTAERLDTHTQVFAIDPLTGNPSSDTPLAIPDNSGDHGVSAGIYLQDEWHLTKRLTLNYGIRYDRFDTSFADAGQLSPRVNLVYKLDEKTTLHAGYSRYFVPPPLQYVGNGTINKFANTTNAPGNFISDPLKVERSNYYDLGIASQITKPWTVNLDGYYKEAHNLIDNGQFGDAVIITPFNYRLGQVFGAELSSTYTQGPVSLFGNFSYVNTMGKDIISQQYLFDNSELAYIHNHYIKLDHEGEYTGSIGASYTFKYDRFYIDALYGSGLRRGFANLGKEPEYLPINIGYEHRFIVAGSDRQVVKVRFDVLNVLDESYQIRDGSGVGVAAAQYGQRRTFLAGLSYEF